MKTRTDPLGRKYSFDYDVAGNLIKTTDAIANATLNPVLGTTTVTFDAENRVVLKDFSDTTPDVSFAYNTVGQLASMVHGQGTETYTYGAGADVGRLMTVARNGTPQFTYTYNLNGDITQRWNTADATFYTYDDDRRIKTVRTGSDATKISAYTYDVASNPIEVAVVGGWKRSTVYDPAGRVQQVTHVGPQNASAINQWIISRDANGNPTSISGLESKRALSYDTANRLTQDCVALPGSTTPCTTAGATLTNWAYDTVGNRSSETVNGVTRTYTYDAADQLTSITGGPTPTTNYTYDQNGNEKTLTCPTACPATRTLAHNVAGQIVSATTPTGVTTYQYDGAGNRARSTDTGTSTTALKYGWDTNRSLPMLSVETTTAGVTVRSYAYGLEPLTMTKDTGTPAVKTYSYLTDMMGSIAVLGTTNNPVPANTQTAFYRYDAYGTRTIATPNLPAGVDTPLQYTGEYNDTTNLHAYNLRARTYDPTNGRFTQTDPTPMGPGSPFESVYVYAGNNPAVYVDPSGLRKTCKAPGVATTCKLFGKAVIDSLPGVSSDFSQCQARQGAAVAGVYEEDVVPVAKVVAVVSATVVTGGLAGTAVAGAGGGYVLTGCTAGAAGSFVPAAMANSGVDAAKTIAGGTAIGCVTGGLGKVINSARAASGEASLAFRSDTSHIFRDAAGHLVEDTAANRALIRSAVKPGNLVLEKATGSNLTRVYQRLLPDGRQVWAEVRNGVEITNGGVNMVPR